MDFHFYYLGRIKITVRIAVIMMAGKNMYKNIFVKLFLIPITFKPTMIRHNRPNANAYPPMALTVSRKTVPPVTPPFADSIRKLTTKTIRLAWPIYFKTIKGLDKYLFL